MHADVITGRQINQTLNKIIKNFMNKYVNPPCFNWLAISDSISHLHLPRRSLLLIKSKSDEEVRVMSPFGGSVASDEPELAIDEGILESSVVPNLQFVPNSTVSIQGGEECVRRILGEIEASDSRTEEASEGEIFIDIIGGLEEEVGSESEGLTLADLLRRADPLPETVLEGMVGVPDLPLC